MRHLIRDFLAQSWIMKAIIAWGWLCVLAMVASFVDNLALFVGS